MKGNRITKAFEMCRTKGEAAFIPFVTAGDPDLDTTYDLVLTMAESGADIIELGIPFSDPLADGPTIQAASQRALQAGVNPDEILDVVELIRRESQIPIVLMGYYNPVLKYGLSAFAERASEAGADGTIIPDLPLEEARDWQRRASENGIANIFLVAPNTPEKRVEKIAKRSKGFLYYVSVTGITGARKRLPLELTQDLERVRSLSPVPVAVGFGISRPEQVSMLREHADGIIVGSAIVKIIEANAQTKKGLLREIRAFVREMKEATVLPSLSPH